MTWKVVKQPKIMERVHMTNNSQQKRTDFQVEYESNRLAMVNRGLKSLTMG